jgi:uncharacterized Zn finger protein (UPF0148 family)
MHCPQCGLEQVSGKVRFCRACGFSLRGVKELVLPDERAAKAEKTRVETAFNQERANNSMDARAKQRLSYQRLWFIRSCVAAVSARVISSGWTAMQCATSC